MKLGNNATFNILFQGETFKCSIVLKLQAVAIKTISVFVKTHKVAIVLLNFATSNLKERRD